jgi:hypothetical protein
MASQRLLLICTGGDILSSGDSLYAWTVHSNEPPDTNFAVYTTRNFHFLLEFDDTTAWSAVFRGVMARNYAGGGVTVRLGWLGATAASGNVKWNVQFERHQAAVDNLDSDSFATAQTTTSVAPVSTGLITYASIAFTNGAQMDSLAIGEGFRLKVTRDAADGADTMVGRAQLLTIELRET